MKEATRKLVVDFPASVMEQLEKRKGEGEGNIKAQILEALEKTFGVVPKPAGE